MRRSWTVLTVSCLIVASACGGDSKDSDDTEPVATTVAPTTTEAVPPTEAPTTAEPEPEGLTAREIVEYLASDELAGRDNLSDGSTAAQQFLIEEIAQFAEPVYLRDGGDGYLQHFAEGANILAMIPGGELTNEVVMLGAHYDHITDCATTDPADTICNGAADNAAGVAAAITTMRALAAQGVPRRTVLLALWDAEEDGLLGSAAYVADPRFPLALTNTYINFDIQGANLSPALANTTVIVGAETGGPSLIELVTAAVANSPLDTLQLSLLYGQGRSDHATFAAAGVPSVFFTDANNGCYHTAQDDVSSVNFDKLDLQIENAIALAHSLVFTDTPAVFDPAAPVTSYNDAVSLLEVVENGAADVGLLAPEAQITYEQYRLDLHAIVDAGPEAFNDEAIGILLIGAVGLVDALTKAACLDV